MIKLKPVVNEYLADTVTPISIYKSLKNRGACFLFESAEGGEKWGRYSIIGLNPQAEIIFSEGHVIIEGILPTKVLSKDPVSILREIISSFDIEESDELPGFAGGLAGFMSYDILRYYEKIPNTPCDDTGFPDAHFFFTTELIVYDHLKHSVKFISYITNKDDEYNIDKIKNKMNDFYKCIQEGARINAPVISRNSYSITSNTSKNDYMEAVARAKDYIRAGDIFQVVLSQRMTYEPSPDSFSVYRQLRSLNPSPYMFYIDYNKYQLVGSSPECLVRLEKGMVETCPIAGTRPRGNSSKEDAVLAEELLKDVKEMAEHAMLVDLGRNDIGKIAKFGSVAVEDYMHVENFSHVMHLVTRVTGAISKEYDAFDALLACLPAGTVSGAPKLRAMEIIDELENRKRGPYAGAVGYFDFRGNMDTCITIRTIMFKEEKAYLQAGAGIVYDSVPEMEYEETMNKLGALKKALEMEGGVVNDLSDR